MRPLSACRTLNPPVLIRLRTVHRSPFFTQSVALIRTLRSLLRVITRSPTLAALPSASSTSRPRGGAGEAVILGALVEAADHFAGRRQHDGVEAVAAVGLPGVEDSVEGGGGVSDMDASTVEVEAERFRPAIAKREGGGGLSRVSEPVQFGEPDRSMDAFDVAEHPAGTDRSQLLIITDQPNTATTADDELNGSVQGEGVGHPGLVDDHQRGPADTLSPIRQVTVVDGPAELGERFGRYAGVVTELRRRGGRRRQPDHLPAAVGPRPSQGAHGGGLAGASGRDRELQPRPGGAHGPDQSGLSGI